MNMYIFHFKGNTHVFSFPHVYLFLLLGVMWEWIPDIMIGSFWLKGGQLSKSNLTNFPKSYDIDEQINIRKGPC